MPVGLLSFGYTPFSFNGGLSQIGLNFPYVARDTFLNMAKASSNWSVSNSPLLPNELSTTGYPLVGTGNPARDTQITAQSNRAGRLRLEWAGPCTLSLNGFGVAGGADAPTGSLTGSLATGNWYEFLPSSSSAETITISAQSAGFTALDDLKLFYVADTADMAAGLLFSRDFKNKLGNGRIAVLRFMDAMFNNTTNVTTWATRKPVAYSTWSGDEYRPSLWGGEASPANLITGSTFAWSGGVVTITTPSPHGLTGTPTIAVSKNVPYQYNGVYTGTVTGASTITYPLSSNPGTNTTAGVFSYSSWNYTAPNLVGDPADKQTNHVTFATGAGTISSSVTVTGAPLDTINWSGHPFVGGECVAFRGNLASNIERCINYYVIASSVVAGVSFKVAATSGGTTPVAWNSAGSSVECIRPPTMAGVGGRAIPIKNSYGDPFTGTGSAPYNSDIGNRNRIGTLVYEASFDCWLMFGGNANEFNVGLASGWPPEVCMALCKETGMHPWACIPYLATDPKTDYATELATLMKSYQDGPCPWMIPRIEPPNELWNFSLGFYATRYAWNKGFINWGIQLNQDQEYGKIASTIGQDVAAVLGAKTNGKYKMIAGFQTITFDSVTTTNSRLAATLYVAGGGLPAYQFVNAACCATYITPPIIYRGGELQLAYAYNVTNAANPSAQAANLNTCVNTLTGISITGAAATLLTIASPGVVNWTAHGFTNLDEVYFTTTGALPTGVTAFRNYPISVIDADHFYITANSTPINFTGSQSGNHTIYQSTFANLNRANLWYTNMPGLLANATYASFGAIEMHSYEGGYSPDQITSEWTSAISSASTAAQCVLSLPTSTTNQKSAIIGTGAVVGMGLVISGRTGSDAATLNTASAFDCAFTGGGSANITGANSLSVGHQVAFTIGSSTSVPPEITAGVALYVVSAGNPFQVSATKGGSAITFATASSGQRANPCWRVTNVSSNNVTVDVDTSGVSPGSGGTVTYVNGRTWDNTMRLAGRFATDLESLTTTNYSNYTVAGGLFPSQFQFIGFTNGSVWSTRDTLYGPISTAWNAIRTFNGAP